MGKHMATTTKREEVDAGDYSHKKSKDYEEDDAYMPFKKERHYDRRQQRVALRSLLPGDLIGNAVCNSGPWAVVGGSCGEGCPALRTSTSFALASGGLCRR